MEFAAGTIRAIIESLQDGMPARVAAFNADAANLIDIVTPATYHFGLADSHAAHPFPQIEVAAVEGNFGLWAVGRSEVDHDVTVNVVIWLQGDTGQIAPIYEQLLGMVKCALEVLHEPDAAGPQVEIPNERGVYWRVSELIPFETDAEDREVRTWLVPAFIQFRFEKVEHFT